MMKDASMFPEYFDSVEIFTYQFLLSNNGHLFVWLRDLVHLNVLY